MMPRLLKVVLVLLVGFLCLSVHLEAQATATVTGVVSDPAGLVLVEATVVLTNPSTGTEYTATTNSAGSSPSSILEHSEAKIRSDGIRSPTEN